VRIVQCTPTVRGKNLSYIIGLGIQDARFPLATPKYQRRIGSQFVANLSLFGLVEGERQQPSALK